MGKKNQRRVKWVSNDSLKSFLQKNKVSLEHIGDEKKQDNYIARLASAALKYKRSFEYMQSGNRDGFEKNYKALKEFEAVILEGKIPDNVFYRLVGNLTPIYPNKQKEEIDAIKKKIEKLEKENKQLKEEKTNKPEPTQKKEEKDSENKEPIKVEGEVVGKRDENIRDIVKDIGNVYKDSFKTYREYKKNKKALRAEEKAGPTIYEGTVKKFDEMRTFLKYYLRSGDSAIDYPLSLVVAMGGLADIALYVTGRTTAKAVKQVGKLGIGVIKGAVTLTALAGKTAFKAAKGTALKCKEKADKVRDEKNQVKFDKTVDVLAELDQATKVVKNLAEKRLNQTMFYDPLDTVLSPRQERYLKNIEDSEKREKTEDIILEENGRLLARAKRRLRDAEYKGIIGKFQDKFNVEYSDVRNWINNVKVDENGELIIGEYSPFTLEEIEEAGLDGYLKTIASLPKIKDFDLEDIENISACLSDELDMKMLEERKEDGQVSKNVYDYIKFMAKEKENNGSDKYLHELAELDALTYDISINNQILQEAYNRDLVDISEELEKQTYSLIHDFREGMDSNKRKDVRKREALRKIAESKLNGLKNTGIIETIQKEDQKQVRILSQAERVLSYDLSQDLEYVKDLNKNKIKDNKDNSEHDGK